MVINQVQNLISNPDSNMEQIAALISKDQAITARVLRLVNSAYFGMNTKITSIQQAIVILGLNTVRNLTLGVSVIKTFKKQDSSHFNREKFWLHSFETAQLAKLIARQKKLPEVEDYFLAGLLHDIGILVLDQYFNNDFAKAIEHSLGEGLHLPEAESGILGADHTEIGEFISEKWQIPPYLVHCIRHHHYPMATAQLGDAAEDIDKIAIVHIADILSRKNGAGQFIENWIGELDLKALKYLAIPMDEIVAIFDKVTKDIKGLMREWGM
jgi:HD-like signal output (HDOD) protein